MFGTRALTISDFHWMNTVAKIIHNYDIIAIYIQKLWKVHITLFIVFLLFFVNWITFVIRELGGGERVYITINVTCNILNVVNQWVATHQIHVSDYLANRQRFLQLFLLLFLSYGGWQLGVLSSLTITKQGQKETETTEEMLDYLHNISISFFNIIVKTGDMPILNLLPCMHACN